MFDYVPVFLIGFIESTSGMFRFPVAGSTGTGERRQGGLRPCLEEGKGGPGQWGEAKMRPSNFPHLPRISRTIVLKDLVFAFARGGSATQSTCTSRLGSSAMVLGCLV
eukprot:TRINITY_DN7807_c0_g1_i2.p1 TRINITY_DN7807_c0_g1~~TRINITY_DN7807_c0_g1_i2.p1  ORF type:complete len:108 (-),score=13.76 TRINITY_DN7807_c0_g1_i2:173-496(-)